MLIDEGEAQGRTANRPRPDAPTGSLAVLKSWTNLQLGVIVGESAKHLAKMVDVALYCRLSSVCAGVQGLNLRHLHLPVEPERHVIDGARPVR